MERLSRALLLGLISFSVCSLHVTYSPVSAHRLGNTVGQTSALLQANVGSLVRIRCQVNMSQDAESIRVKWIKEMQWNCCHIFNSSHLRSEMRCSERIYCALEENVVTLIIEDAQIADSGKYKCEVIIELPPPFIRKSGLWITLNVTAQSDPGHWLSKGGLPVWGWIALGVATVVLFALILSVVCYFRKRRRHVVKDDPFYRNVIFSKKRKTAAKNLTCPERCSHSHYTTNRRPGGKQQNRVSWRRTGKPRTAPRSPNSSRSAIKPRAASCTPKHTDQQVERQRPAGFEVRRDQRGIKAQTAQIVPTSRPMSSQAGSKKQTEPTSNPAAMQTRTQKQMVPMSRPTSSQAAAQKPRGPKTKPTTSQVIAHKPSIPMKRPVSSQVNLENERMPMSRPTSSQVTAKVQLEFTARSSSGATYANSADQPQAETNINTPAAQRVAVEVAARESNSYVNAPRTAPKTCINKQRTSHKR